MMKKFLKVAAVLMTTTICMLSVVGCGSKESTTPEANTETTDEVEPSETETTEEAEQTTSDTEEGKRLEGETLIFTDDTFNPYRIVDENGNTSGYDFEVLSACQEILGFDYEFVNVEFAAVLSSISAGTADFGMTLQPTEERKESYDFTQEYYQPKSGVGVVAGSDIKSWADLEGKTIIAPSATNHAKVAYAAAGANVVEMESVPLGCEEVVAGRADAIICDSVQLENYAKEYDFDTFTVSQEEHGVEFNGYTMGFIKGSPYVEDFNYALDMLKENGTLTELQKEWLGEDNAITY